MLITQAVKDKRLIGFGDVGILEPITVCQVQFHRNSGACHARQFRVNDQVESLTRLDTQYKLVSLNLIKFMLNVAELYANFRFSFIKGFASLHDKRHIAPTFIVNVQHDCGKRRRVAILWNCFIVLIARLAICCSILTEEDMVF